MIQEHLLRLLKEKVKPAIGCTEPVAIALAVARAHEAIGGNLTQIHLVTSGNVFKNANGVGIPGTTEYGIPFAIVLALACGDSTKGLEVFADVTDEAVVKAQALLTQISISITTTDDEGAFFIAAELTGDNGNAKCIIRDQHTNIVHVEKNGETLFHRESAHTDDTPAYHPILQDMNLKELREAVEAFPLEDIAFLIAGVPMNFRMANVGLEKRPGLALGGAIADLIEEGVLESNLINKVRMYAAAAADARMAGLKLPVMSSAGSGNHGIMAILPPYIVCRELNLDEEKLIRALAFSHLTTIAIKEFSGALSPVCGCAIAAGVGAAVAVAWLLDADDTQIAGTVNSMIGTLAGMLCDGAKGGCAFKLSTAAGEAILAALLAKRNVYITAGQGIVAVDASTTIQNIGLISTQGMKNVDSTVINVMLAKA